MPHAAQLSGHLDQVSASGYEWDRPEDVHGPIVLVTTDQPGLIPV
jgi:hypothetical protein